MCLETSKAKCVFNAWVKLERVLIAATDQVSDFIAAFFIITEDYFCQTSIEEGFHPNRIESVCTFVNCLCTVLAVVQSQKDYDGGAKVSHIMINYV